MSLFGPRVFADMIELKIERGLPWTIGALNPVTSVFMKEGKKRERQSRGGMRPPKHILQGCDHKPRNASNQQKLPEAKCRSSPGALRGSTALLASQLQAYGLQNGDRIKFMLF